MSTARIALFVSFVTLVGFLGSGVFMSINRPRTRLTMPKTWIPRILSQHLSSSIKVPVNNTEGHDENRMTEDEDDTLASEDNDDFRERYRRLIPYMTYYLVNNYVNGHQPNPSGSLGQAYVSQSESSVHRRPTTPQATPSYVTLRPLQVTKSRYQVQKNEEQRFVPSVQYDPKDINPDGDYFMPVRYNTKETYEDYSGIPIRTTRPMPITIPEVRYHTTSSRPTSFSPQKLKLQQEYAYGDRAPEDFESIRFTAQTKLQQQQQQQQQQMRYVEPVAPRPTILEPVPQSVPRVSLNHVLKSLQLTNQLPEVLSNDNIDSSIKTLMEILNILNAGKKETYSPVYGKYKPTYAKPKVITESNYEASQISVTPHNELVEIKPASPYIKQFKAPIPVPQDDLIELKPVNPYIGQIKPAISSPNEEVVEIKPVRPYVNQIKSQLPAPLPTNTRLPSENNKIVEYYVPIVQDIDKEKNYNSVKEPLIPHTTEQPIGNQYEVDENNDEILEDERYTLPVTTEEPRQQIPTHIQSIPSSSLKYGATRGKPHIDYPAYTEIPETNFSCKQQRYKGFFGDPETGCQVWHYCDLNGGKSSFLCPNGTIFSQVALTCDWWFNVKCESTTQLYVLNERLYKYILPIMPKFPEDFTGPEVDKYLELKFKEMEAKLKEKKMKKEQEERDKSTLNTLQSIEDSK